MNNQTVTLELERLQHDINNLLVPSEFSRPTITVGSIKNQIISRLIEEANGSIRESTYGLYRAWKKGVKKCKKDFNRGAGSKASWFCLWLPIIFLLFFFVSLLASSFSMIAWTSLFLSLSLALLTLFVFYPLSSIKRTIVENRKIRKELESQLGQKLTKLENDKAYLVSQIQKQLNLTNTLFKNRFIDIEASFKKIASEPRDRIKQVIQKLEKQRERVVSLSNSVSCQEDRDKMVSKINETIQSYEQFMAEINPKEERLLASAVDIKEQLKKLEAQINNLDSIQSEYQEYQNILDELSEHNIVLEDIRSKHSSNIGFIQLHLHELGRDIFDIHQAIGGCRYLLPGFEFTETLALPAPETELTTPSIK